MSQTARRGLLFLRKKTRVRWAGAEEPDEQVREVLETNPLTHPVLLVDLGVVKLLGLIICSCILPAIEE